MTIYQHADTDVAVSALRHPAGTTETNRSSAVQIELIGFASVAKDVGSLGNMARLCRWIEATHQVPREWPNGRPKPAVDGHDPGGHNRNAANWNEKGGHYGHSQVPNNTHWDPGYTDSEVDIILGLNAPEAQPVPPSLMADHGGDAFRANEPDPPEGVNQQGLELIKSFEGLRLIAYEDVAGIWTVGYGHTRGVYPGMTITQEEAEAFLRQDLSSDSSFVETAVAGLLTGSNQLSAMISLCFNIGSGNFKNSSVLRYHRNRNYAAAADAFLLWDKAHVDGQLVVLEGLRRRRRAERELYLHADV